MKNLLVIILVMASITVKSQTLDTAFNNRFAFCKDLLSAEMMFHFALKHYGEDAAATDSYLSDVSKCASAAQEILPLIKNKVAEKDAATLSAILDRFIRFSTSEPPVTEKDAMKYVLWLEFETEMTAEILPKIIAPPKTNR